MNKRDKETAAQKFTYRLETECWESNPLQH